MLDLVPYKVKTPLSQMSLLRCYKKQLVNICHLGCLVILLALRVIGKAWRRSLSLSYSPNNPSPTTPLQSTTMSMTYIGFRQTPSLSLGLWPLADCFHSPLRAIPNLNYEVLKQKTPQLQPTLDIQGVVKDNDPTSPLSSPIIVAKHEENTTVERLDITTITIPF